ncbi:hypothetical protein CHARACLAT_023417 [Characodon lateralis]|uniref:Uncharacterized protein n=1 Tax=Characodon lateralis TaxID=208331 RepID=A0ABU7DTK9_9TELE|nr:hypothetical protein [Characodon lateralis]
MGFNTTGYPTLPNSSLQHLPRIPTKEKRGATKDSDKCWLDGNSVGWSKAKAWKNYFPYNKPRDFEEVGDLSDLSDSDPEIVIKKSSEFDLADTLPWEPLDESSPLQKVAETENGVGDLVLSNDAQQVIHLNNRNNPGTPECLTVQSSCIVIDEEDDVEDLTHDTEKNLPTEEPVL